MTSENGKRYSSELGAQFYEYVLLLTFVIMVVLAGLQIFGAKTGKSIDDSAGKIAAAG